MIIFYYILFYLYDLNFIDFSLKTFLRNAETSLVTAESHDVVQMLRTALGIDQFLLNPECQRAPESYLTQDSVLHHGNNYLL